VSAAALDQATALAALPPDWPDDPLPDIRRQVAASGHKIVVLDDDPTGTQTVYGVSVLTTWGAAELADELRDLGAACYLLTNSRSLPERQAVGLAGEIGRALTNAASVTSRKVQVISRSDSTLRGHFPAEVDALAAALGGADATLIIPAFLDGGRYTINDTHYVAQGSQLIPAGQTPFARDAAFGYRASHLPSWVAEKTGGRVPAASVASVAIADIRLGGSKRVAERLLALPTGCVCIVNAASERDMAVVAAGMLVAEAAGRRFMPRTAASFVAARLGLPKRPLLTAVELGLPPGGGLVVAGSYVPATTAQLQELRARSDAAFVTVEVAALLAEDRAAAIAAAAKAVCEALAAGRDAVLVTSRELISDSDPERSLRIGSAVSDGLVAVVRALGIRPRYLLAKGGITSSDVATKGLDVRRAEVLGQLLPGVSVWRLGRESRAPGLAYIVFPGNVGGPGALADAVEVLKQP
jgi:uncharacterized protein YgbK (DUF1537 family)